MKTLKLLVLVLMLFLGGCGLGIGVEGVSGPALWDMPVSVTLSEAAGWGFSEFRARVYPRKPLWSEIGLGVYGGPLGALWKTPVPVPAVGVHLGVEQFKPDSAHSLITGLYGQAGVEWILLRNRRAGTPRVKEGDFLWLYLNTYAKLLYRFPRTFVPTLGLELGFRLRAVPSL